MGLFRRPALQIWQLMWRPWAEVTPVLQAVGKAQCPRCVIPERMTKGSECGPSLS